MNQQPGRGTALSKYSAGQDSFQIDSSPEIKLMIRRKVSSYLQNHIDSSPQVTKQSIVAKKTKAPLPREYPSLSSLVQLLKEEKTVHHLFKEKIESRQDQSVYFVFKVLTLAIDYQCRVSAKELDRDSSLMVDSLLFVASALLQVGASKAAFYFGCIGIQVCEYSKVLHPIGQFLLILAKILRKHFRYKESIILLKKALEYNWWRDRKRTEDLNTHFLEWLTDNSPDEIDIFSQKFEVARVFWRHETNSLKSYRSNTLGKDLQLEVFRQLFLQFLQAARIKLQTLNFDIILKRNNEVSHRRERDLQIQIYNELSFNFLQLNMKEESKLFGQKYESGYIESEDSKIISLSCQLIHSVQKRLTGWHQVGFNTINLLMFVNIFEVVRDSRATLRSVDQEAILKLFKINFEKTIDSLFRKQMFSYQIPLPLQIRREVPKTKKKSDGRKFIVKQRSVSHMSKGPTQIIRSKYTSDKVEENLLLNYRGTGISRSKLLNVYNRFMESVREKERQGSFKLVDWTAKIDVS